MFDTMRSKREKHNRDRIDGASETRAPSMIGNRFEQSNALVRSSPGKKTRQNRILRTVRRIVYLARLKHAIQKGRPICFAANISVWKRDHLRRCFPELHFHFLDAKRPVHKYDRYLKKTKNIRFLVWGYHQPVGLSEYARERGIHIYRMEDGFLRSVGLGSNHILPLSVCIDSRSLYFDARSASDLEFLLQTYDFHADASLMALSKRSLEIISAHGLTKYNLPATHMAEDLYGPKCTPRILVIGQVEDDQSVRFGCEEAVTNNDVVRLAAQENPGAQIIYKVHPDVLAGKRPQLSNPKDIEDISLIVRDEMCLDDALSGVDRVYTISSLAGFESLCRGVPVTTIGCPFYAGWGLTDDRQPNPRRRRKLSVEEVFAGAYILYARYFDPTTGRPITITDVLNIIRSSFHQQQAMPPANHFKK